MRLGWRNRWKRMGVCDGCVLRLVRLERALKKKKKKKKRNREEEIGV